MRTLLLAFLALPTWAFAQPQPLDIAPSNARTPEEERKSFKVPDGTKSPNLGDVVMILFGLAQNAAMSISDDALRAL